MGNGESSTPSSDARSFPGLIQVTIGLLLGSGGAGAALALIGGEGPGKTGLTALGICVGAVIVVLLLAGLEEYLRRQRSIRFLNDTYVSTLNNVGKLLARALEAEEAGEGHMDRSKILQMLASDFRGQREHVQKQHEYATKVFRAGAKRVADQWEVLAEEGTPKDRAPEESE